MNKNTILIGSLCIVILLLIGVLYVMKTNEGFADPPATGLLTTAKQAVTEATTASDAAKKAVGSATEVSTAKDAFSKATAAVTAANAAVSTSKEAVGNVNITDLENFAKQAQTQLVAAQAKEKEAKDAVDVAQKTYDTSIGTVKSAQTAVDNLR
jgi:hypothetical protein